MKKLLLFLPFALLLIIASCGGDDEPAPQPGLSGNIAYKGQTYAISNGIFIPSVGDGEAVGDFYLADGTITANNSGNSVSTSDSQIILSIQAFSRGTAILVNGTYETSTNVPDQYAFVRVSTMENGQLVSNDSFVGGEVIISGSGSTFTLTFDVPFAGQVKLTGSVNGTYELQ